ncbi:hypothetical protein GLW08_07360 [Pontibacillus yanchengensis]|uniref:Uncharacterized protein n=2 Tax=Pontibacillus yanchengensis TaxID=462910 RepID=A0A6I4ZYQ9_9BACI|nr:hypothetical protein [Pontibacillus yanchengensis]MYL34066.1 hypothetical protein [Pontibacillus yanchengensis]MYL53154.1 hypothetical protein [Pontibacillus yanchengensis]
MVTIISKMTEFLVLATVCVLFAGYAVFLYPLEKLQTLTSPEVKQKQLEHAPN